MTYGPLEIKPKELLRYSENSAQRLGHEYIGAHHLISGMLTVGNNTGGILKNGGIQLQAFETELLRLIARSQVMPFHAIREKSLPYTERCKKTIERASQLAQRRCSSHIEEFDLLRAICEDRDSVASIALDKLNFKTEDLERKLSALGV